MAFQPGFAVIAALVADPAREAMLVALADGCALPAGELALAAGVSAQSASRHLHKMIEGGVLSVWSQGRFRYYRIADAQVASAIESLCLLAQRPSNQATARRGRRMPPPELCFARRCYNHLGGALGVMLSSMFQERGYMKIKPNRRDAELTVAGLEWLAKLDIRIDGETGKSPERADVRLCMDWTERRPHLSGPIAGAILRYLVDNRLLHRLPASRAFRLTSEGRKWFTENCGAELQEDAGRSKLSA